MQVPKEIWVGIGAVLLGVLVPGMYGELPPVDSPSDPVRFAHEPVRHPLTLRAVVDGPVVPGGTVDVRLDVTPWHRAEDVVLTIEPGAVRMQGTRVRRVAALSAGSTHSEHLRVVLPDTGIRHLLEIRARARVDDAILERAVYVNFVLRPEPRRSTVDRNGRRIWFTPAERIR